MTETEEIEALVKRWRARVHLDEKWWTVETSTLSEVCAWLEELVAARSEIGRLRVENQHLREHIKFITHR